MNTAATPPKIEPATDPYIELAIRAHVTLLTIGDVIRYASNPNQQHLLPGAIGRHNKATKALNDLAEQADKRIPHAISLNLESTTQIQAVMASAPK